MPITGLTKNSEVGSGLPLIARLYKGSEKEERTSKDGKKYEVVGKDLDHFRVEFEPQFEHLRELWVDMYGPEPKGFDQVFMSYATVDEAFSSWKEEWTATTMMHRCDGEHQVMWYSQQAQAYSRAKEKCAATHVSSPCHCANIGRLNLLIPEFIEAAGILGYVLVTTKSINDILTVYRTLADIQRINGTLLGVPFTLGRAMQKISAPKTERNGKVTGRINVNKSLFYLHVDPDFTRQTLLPRLASSGGFLNGNQPPALPSPTIEPSLAREMLGSGDTRRLGGIPKTDDETVIESDAPLQLPPAPEAKEETIPGTPVISITDAGPTTTPPAVTTPQQNPLDILDAGLEEFGVDFAKAATVLKIKDINDPAEWRQHGTTPKAIAEKVKGLLAESKSPFAGTPAPKATPETQEAWDAIESSAEKPLFGALLATGGTQALHAAAEYAKPVAVKDAVPS